MDNLFTGAFAIGAGISAGAAVPWVILGGSVAFAVTGTIATIDVMTHNFEFNITNKERRLDYERQNVSGHDDLVKMVDELKVEVKDILKDWPGKCHVKQWFMYYHFVTRMFAVDRRIDMIHNENSVRKWEARDRNLYSGIWSRPPI
jgi:hypothetical protein